MINVTLFIIVFIIGVIIPFITPNPTIDSKTQIRKDGDCIDGDKAELINHTYQFNNSTQLLF